MKIREDKVKRRRNVEKALCINCLGGVNVSQDYLELSEKYIQGEITAEEMTKILIDKYKQ